jgi:rhodanese-related sulfurtransferase
MSYKTISPAEFAERAARGERIRLIDVREPEEFELARVEGAELLPLSRAGRGRLTAACRDIEKAISHQLSAVSKKRSAG